jgi:hypothetical protein
MTKENQQIARKLTTRRGLIVSNAKAIVAITAGVVAANLTNVSSAQAHDGRGGWWSGWWNGHGGHDDHGGHHGGGHSGGGQGGTPCFLRGTKIRTADGERSVEELAIGDRLPTALAGTRPIQWIGSWRHNRKPNGAWQRFAQPVRIARSALAPNVPHADLYVTQGHALFIDGVLIAAGSLVNGSTIVLDQAEQFDELEYFHIKLASHDVIFAEGAACETLLRLPETATDFTADAGCDVVAETRDESCAPVVCNSPSSEIRSRIRSMFSPVLGPQKIDLIRARLEQNAMALS